MAKKESTRLANGKIVHLCSSCSTELATIEIPVDGNFLHMQSCDNCDMRTWQLAGQRIDLKDVLAEVKEHVGKKAKSNH